MEQDIVLVPCNPGQSKHWFLLVVLHKEKQILDLDSKAGSFTKPSIEGAVVKMLRILREIDNNIDVRFKVKAVAVCNQHPKRCSSTTE